MPDAFSCPECGSEVAIRGLAPGRQVRCEFCRRLLEVPFLPRHDEPAWKRRRFGRPRWLPWAWSALGVLGIGVVVAAGVRIVGREAGASLTRSIDRLAASAEAHEKCGEFARAVIDLDTAINLCIPEVVGHRARLEDLHARRRVAARKDATAVLDGLSGDRAGRFPVGEWLTLGARVAADRDLASLKDAVEKGFQSSLRHAVQGRLETARGLAARDDGVAAFDACCEAEALLHHLVEPDRSKLRDEAGQIVSTIVRHHGLVVSPLAGQFLAGTQARYNATMIPALDKMLRARGYVPRPESSSWYAAWSEAPFRLTIQIREMHEGNYLGSQNRLTRIEAQLSLTRHGRQIWTTAPVTRTNVPLPRLPAYLSSRVALSPARIDEFERLLYDDARSRIDERFVNALANVPASADPGR